MACVSAMRKAIGREAMEFAVELLHTSKAFHSMVCNRLEVICDEDLDTLAAPHVFPFVAAALAASREVLGAEVPCGLSLRCGHRGLRSLLEDYAPTIPTGPTISTTIAGKKLGRGPQVGTARAGEVRTVEVCVGEVAVDEVSVPQVWADIGVATPGVPDSHALLEQCDVLFVCHGPLPSLLDGADMFGASNRYSQTARSSPSGDEPKKHRQSQLWVN
jgi:hypothetical protein